MISKKVAMKTPEKSRFGKLVAYLLDPQDKKTRVGEVVITNCISTDITWAVPETGFAQGRRKPGCSNAARDREAFLQGARLR